MSVYVKSHSRLLRRRFPWTSNVEALSMCLSRDRTVRSFRRDDHRDATADDSRKRVTSEGEFALSIGIHQTPNRLVY